jgi:hypothetical protein
VEYPGTSESKEQGLAKTMRERTRTKCLTADCHRGIFDGTRLAVPKGVAVKSANSFSNDPQLFSLELTIEFSCCSGLRLQHFPFVNIYTRFKPFPFPFFVPAGSNDLQTVCTRFKRLE